MNPDESYAVTTIRINLWRSLLLKSLSTSNSSQKFNGQSKIYICENGNYINTDLLDSINNHNFAKATNFTGDFEKPNNEVKLCYRCPRNIGDTPSEHCIKRERNWKCNECKEFLKIGYNGYIYCECGQAPPNNFLFKCGDPVHGEEFYPQDEENFFDYIEETQPRKQLVILVLGESGVGKSTWINSIANYMAYSTLEEAQNSQPICLIPCRLEMRDENNQKRTIDIKANANNETDFASNEILERGKSATQDPRTYIFNWKHYEVN